MMQKQDNKDKNVKDESIKTADQQLQKQLKQLNGKNPLPEIVGKWPGDETDEEFEQMIKELD